MKPQGMHQLSAQAIQSITATFTERSRQHSASHFLLLLLLLSFSLQNITCFPFFVYIKKKKPDYPWGPIILPSSPPVFPIDEVSFCPPLSLASLEPSYPLHRCCRDLQNPNIAIHLGQSCAGTAISNS